MFGLLCLCYNNCCETTIIKLLHSQNSCDGGYKLQGSSVRTCQNSERWSGTSAVCEQGSAINKINKSPLGDNESLSIVT